MGREVADRLRDYYEKRFPAWQGISVAAFARVGQGSENEVYSFRLGFEEAGEKRGEDLILRIYPGDGGDEKSKKEYSTMEYLHSVDYPVPQMKLRESDPSVLGKPFVVMEKVAGPLMGDIFFKSSRQKRRELLDLFCRMFVRLHRLDWRAFGKEAPSDRAQDPHLAMLDKVSQVQEVFHSLDKSEFDPVFDWLRRQSASLEFDDPSLIHWDYHPWNIIMRDDGTACVIDWTQAEVLDFRFDLGWTLVLVSTHAHPWLARAVLRKYERIAGTRVASIEYFEVAACLKRLFAASAFLTHGPERIGMRPGAEVVLKDHAPPLRRVYSMLRKRTGISIPEVETFLHDLR